MSSPVPPNKVSPRVHEASLAKTASTRRAAQYARYGQATGAKAAAASDVRPSEGRLRRPTAGPPRDARPLLAVDGDSLAHRAYHGLPKSITRGDGRPAGAITGFANFLLRLWESEQPRAVVVGWDTLEVPTYRHEALAGYQAGRVFDDALLEQLAMLPELVEAFGFRFGRAGGFEADDFLAACARAEEERGGTCLVVTSDRDAFQLAGERTTILRPVRGVSVLERVGPAEVRELYGVGPEQVTDFIALRGDPSDRIPGAKGVGAKTAAAVLQEYGTLEAALEAGRFAAEAEDLRLYRRIATLDASAPLPSLSDQTPTWAEASSLTGSWGMTGLADRLAERRIERSSS